tara:strand:+ start:75 stop:236 length:162 start_codon:yes stop_codon:yes gene_type:complete
MLQLLVGLEVQVVEPNVVAEELQQLVKEMQVGTVLEVVEVEQVVLVMVLLVDQ